MQATACREESGEKREKLVKEEEEAGVATLLEDRTVVVGTKHQPFLLREHFAICQVQKLDFGKVSSQTDFITTSSLLLPKSCIFPCFEISTLLMILWVCADFHLKPSRKRGNELLQKARAYHDEEGLFHLHHHLDWCALQQFLLQHAKQTWKKGTRNKLFFPCSHAAFANITVI